ncbi:unnamed protein product [Cylicocyclus nassatus]|uniref:Uncharacterized protein n=1 Tax=Cylicocyclus nassatus TaxID=53992 RepID=A0AA36H4N2_CYLNA|nr:unnamed protein product [Cylicocyclus nassatus]
MKLNILTCSIVLAVSGVQADENSVEASLTTSMETLGPAFSQTTLKFSTEWTNLTEAISRSTTPSTTTTASGSQNDLDNSLDTEHNDTQHPNAIDRSPFDKPRKPHGPSNNFTFNNEV